MADRNLAFTPAHELVEILIFDWRRSTSRGQSRERPFAGRPSRRKELSRSHGNQAPVPTGLRDTACLRQPRPGSDAAALLDSSFRDPPAVDAIPVDGASLVAELDQLSTPLLHATHVAYSPSSCKNTRRIQRACGSDDGVGGRREGQELLFDVGRTLTSAGGSLKCVT